MFQEGHGTVARSYSIESISGNNQMEKANPVALFFLKLIGAWM